MATTISKANPRGVAEGVDLAPDVVTMRKRASDLRRIESVDLMNIIPNDISEKPPQQLMVRPTELWVNSAYQRDISRSGMKLILSIVSGFSWQKFRAPVISRDEQGRFVIIDGQHTSIGAASHPQIDKIPASFVPMTSEELQAAAFISHNTAMVRVAPIDLFFAKVTAGDETALKVLEILGRHGVTLARYLPNTGSYEPNQTIATGGMMDLMRRYGAARFDTIVRVVSKCNLCPIRSDHLKAIAVLLFESAADDIKIDPELLGELIRGVPDTESLQQGSRIALSTRVTKANAMAIFWRNRYKELFGRQK